MILPLDRTCASCGRKGRRGFKKLGPTKFGDDLVPAIILCSNVNACRKRAWRMVPPEARRFHRGPDE